MKILSELKNFDIIEFIKLLVDFLEHLYRDYSKDKFKNYFRKVRTDFYHEMESLLKEIYNVENEFRAKIKRMKEELSGIQFNEEIKKENLVKPLNKYKNMLII